MRTFGNDVSLAVRRINARKWTSLLCIVLFSLAFGLLASVVALQVITGGAERNLKRSLSGSIDQYGFVEIDYPAKKKEIEEQYGSMEGLYREILALPAVRAIGSVSLDGIWGMRDEAGSSEVWDTIIKTQRKKALPTDWEMWRGNPEVMDSCVQGVSISQSLWDALNLTLREGELPGKENDEILIYLGYYLRGLAETGTVLSNGGTNCRIMGTLKKGSIVPDDFFLYWNHSMDMTGLGIVQNSTYSLDNLILVVYPQNYGGKIDEFMEWEKGYTVEEVEEQIAKVISPFGLLPEVSSLTEKMEVDLAFNREYEKPLSEMAFVIGIISLLMVLCTQLLSVLQKKNDLGILLSQGISKSSLYRILVFENLIQIFLAILISPLVVMQGGVYDGYGSAAVKEAFWSSTIGPVLGVLLLLGIVLTILASCVVLALVTKTPASSLLKGELKQSRFVYRALFVMALVVSFSLIAYGAYLKDVSRRLKEETDRADYHYVISSIENGTAEAVRNFVYRQKEKPYEGFTELSADLNINRRTYATNVCVVLAYDEPLLYSLQSGCYPVGAEYRGTPACIIGEGYLPETYEEGEKRYILLEHRPFEVTGILACNHFWGFDFRIITYEHTLKDDFLNDLLSVENVVLKYCGMPELTAENVSDVSEQFYQSFGDALCTEPMEWYDSMAEGVDSSQIISALYEKICLLLMVFSLINLALVSHIWGVRRQLKHMICLVNGYRRPQIFMLDFLAIVKLELLAAALMAVGLLAMGLFKGNTGLFLLSVIREGRYGLVGILIFTVITVLMGTVRLWFEKPAVILKHTE